MSTDLRIRVDSYEQNPDQQEEASQLLYNDSGEEYVWNSGIHLDMWYLLNDDENGQVQRH